MTELKGKKIKFLGIGGVGVNALAKYAIDEGAEVFGYDRTINYLCREFESSGGKMVGEFDGGNYDAVVYTSAIKLNDDIRQNLNCKKILERHEFLGEVSKDFKRVVAVAGTHGKTTTTAMLAHILAGRRQNFAAMIGGDSLEFNNYVNNTSVEKDIFLTEACEYKRSFLSLDPFVAVVTNIECDHPDCYKNIDEVKEAFDEFLHASENYVYLADDFSDEWKIVCKGRNFAAEYEAEFKNGECRLYKDGVFIGNAELSDSGIYNFKNATCAVAAASILGIDEKESLSLLRSYPGVKRRFEYVGKLDGTRTFFDFAHHPTEIGCVLDRAAMYGRELVIFQPHTYSRTKAYFDDFVRVLSKKEIGTLIFLPTYAAREDFDASVDSTAIQRAIAKNGGKHAYVADNADSAVEFIMKRAKFYDVILFIGAGDIYNIKDKLQGKLTP